MQFPFKLDIGLVTPLFEIFRQPEVALWLAGGILATAAAALVWFFIRRAAPVLISLWRVQRRLRSIRDHDAFSSDFAQIDSIISRVGLLRHGWGEFRETLIFPRDGDLGVIRNTARPSAYLNVGAVSAKLHLPLYQALPNYFVGIGLLFTFLGLVAALYFASEGVAGKSAEEAQRALQDLLSAATFKFSTSIAGLFSSLVLSFAVKWLTIRIQIVFDGICTLLEERLAAVTPEGLAVDQQRELEKQTLQLERFNTDFAVEVAKALEERLTISLGTVIGQAVQPMATAIEGMAKGFGEMNQDAMQRIVQDFQKSLQGAAGTEMQAIAGALGGLSQTLNHAIQKMDHSGGQFGSRIEAAAKQLETVVAEAGSSLQTQVSAAAERLEIMLGEISSTIANSLSGATGQLQSAAGTIGQDLQSAAMPIAEEFTKVKDALGSLDAKLRVQMDGFEMSVGQMRQLSVEFGHLLGQIRDAGIPLLGLAEKFEVTAARINSTAGVISEAQTKLIETSTSISAGAVTLKETFEQYRARFEKVDDDLEKVFVKLQEGTMAYHQRILEYVKEVDGHFTSSVNLLAGGIEELKDSVEELTETAVRMRPAAE